MTLEDVLLYLIAGATSLLFSVVGISRFNLNPRLLREVLGDLVECVGTCVIFLLINSLIGILLVFLIRSIRFFSFYQVANGMLIALSAIQGIAFQLWWNRSRDNRD